MNIKSYNTILKYVQNYYFRLCLIGNLITSDYKMKVLKRIGIYSLSFCDKVILSNDNPRHFIDPNSCLKKNKNDCYGEINRTCFIPKSISKPKSNRIDIVTFWNENIVNGKKCLYYYNYLPIYADNNHFSLFYLKIIVEKIVTIISKYVEKDKRYEYDITCPYYHIQHIKFHYNNLNQQNCLSLRI